MTDLDLDALETLAKAVKADPSVCAWGYADGHVCSESCPVVELSAVDAKLLAEGMLTILTRLRHEQQAREQAEAAQQVLTNRAAELLDHAEQAEAQLAALTARIEALPRWIFAWRDEEMEEDENGDWLRRADVLAALRPPAQPDTPPPTSTPGEQP